MSEAKELKRRIKSMESTLIAYRSEKSNPETLQSTLDFHREQAAFHVRQIELIEARLQSNEHIENMQRNIKLAKHKLSTLQAEKAIAATKPRKRDKRTLASVHAELLKEFGDV